MIEKWYRVDLSQDQIAWDNQVQLVTEEIEKLMLPEGFPDDAALFCRDVQTKELYQALYFSPALARAAPRLVIEFGGVESDPPPKDAKTHLLIGNDQSKEMLL